MKVELIDTMGSDLTVVNAARVSYAKHHDTFDDSDARLLRYLARERPLVSVFASAGVVPHIGQHRGGQPTEKASGWSWL